MNQSLQPRFTKMISRHEESLRSYAMKLTGDCDDANDLFQDTCLNGWRFLNSFQEGSNERAWLGVIMRNAFINGFRRIRKTPEMVGYEDVYFIAQPLTDSRERELSDEVLQALGCLDKTSRTLFVMDVLGEYNYFELGKVFNIPRGTVASRLRRSRQALRSALG